METIGVASGCGCKEVPVYYITYPYSSCMTVSVLFCSSIPTFCSLTLGAHARSKGYCCPVCV